MYILAHLLAGVLIGIVLYLIFHDRLVILFAALGSVLPDLIDKPIGHILLSGSLDYGRIYAHTLLFAGLILVIGLIISLRYKRAGPLTIALVAGILSHQLLDAMWLEPVNWYWPALGPFEGKAMPDFFINGFWGEITNPGEWAAGILLLVIVSLIYIWPDRITSFQSRFSHRYTLLITAIFASVLGFGIVVFIAGGYG